MLLLLASTRRLAMLLTGAGCLAMLLLGYGYSNSYRALLRTRAGCMAGAGCLVGAMLLASSRRLTVLLTSAGCLAILLLGACSTMLLLLAGDRRLAVLLLGTCSTVLLLLIGCFAGAYRAAIFTLFDNMARGQYKTGKEEKYSELHFERALKYHASFSTGCRFG